MGLRASKTKKTIVFNKEDYEKLQRIAMYKDMSLSELLRNLIKDYIKDYEE